MKFGPINGKGLSCPSSGEGAPILTLATSPSDRIKRPNEKVRTPTRLQHEVTTLGSGENQVRDYYITPKVVCDWA